MYSRIFPLFFGFLFNILPKIEITHGCSYVKPTTPIIDDISLLSDINSLELHIVDPDDNSWCHTLNVTSGEVEEYIPCIDYIIPWSEGDTIPLTITSITSNGVYSSTIQLVYKGTSMFSSGDVLVFSVRARKK